MGERPREGGPPGAVRSPSSRPNPADQVAAERAGPAPLTISRHPPHPRLHCAPTHPSGRPRGSPDRTAARFFHPRRNDRTMAQTATAHLLADRQVDVETPEHVAIGYELADLGSRFTALLLDWVLHRAGACWASGWACWRWPALLGGVRTSPSGTGLGDHHPRRVRADVGLLRVLRRPARRADAGQAADGDPGGARRRLSRHGARCGGAQPDAHHRHSARPVVRRGRPGDDAAPADQAPGRPGRRHRGGPRPHRPADPGGVEVRRARRPGPPAAERRGVRGAGDVRRPPRVASRRGARGPFPQAHGARGAPL